MDWQKIISILIVALAALWAGKMLLTPVLAALRPPKPGRCAGGCGCGHEEKNTLPDSGKASACTTPGPEYQSRH